jgi:uncharacterized protein YgiM (DUF1202 family)
MNKEKKSTLEELMKPEEREEIIADDKRDAISLDEPKKRTWLVVLLAIFATLLVLAGGYVAWQSYNADKELKAEEKIEVPVTEEQNTEEPVIVEQAIYTNAVEGLNLRKEADATSEVLAIIPFGTKLVVLETSGDWYKVEYDSKLGWVAKLYTADTNPLVYKNTTYGFGLTFPNTWGSYTVVKRDDSGVGVTAYYDVFLNTADTAVYSDGKSSMFVIGVYTPTQWATINAEEGPKPTVLKETAKYVYTYSMSQATPEDLMARRADVTSIVKTLIEL